MSVGVSNYSPNRLWLYIAGAAAPDRPALRHTHGPTHALWTSGVCAFLRKGEAPGVAAPVFPPATPSISLSLSLALSTRGFSHNNINVRAGKCYP